MLLADSNIEDNQRISILAAATANGAATNTTTETTDEQLLDSLKYESIASIIRQFDIKNKPAVGSVQASIGKFQKKKRNLRLSSWQISSRSHNAKSAKSGVSGNPIIIKMDHLILV